jgi:nickel transport protein
MVWKTLSRVSFSLMIFLGVTMDKVLAHSTVINYQTKESIEIEAKFDNGTPMKNAQVVIYSPNNPTEAWLTSTTDENGKLVFTPDFSQLGNWSIKVRTAGHGAVINIPIESESTKTDDSDTQEIITSRSTSPPPMNATLTTAQKLVMATTGVWGFVGTALFFSRKKD